MSLVILATLAMIFALSVGTEIVMPILLAVA
jgi:hypothetical protein